MVSKNKPVVLASIEETIRIARNLLTWLNTFPDLPVDVITYEHLPAVSPSMMMSSVQGAYITKRYICGGYQAEYQFNLTYRIRPGTSIHARLDADETLNRIATIASGGKPDLGDGIRAIKVEATTMSALYAPYEDGDEDHQIMMKLTYEVNV